MAHRHGVSSLWPAADCVDKLQGPRVIGTYKSGVHTHSQGKVATPGRGDPKMVIKEGAVMQTLKQEVLVGQPYPVPPAVPGLAHSA